MNFSQEQLTKAKAAKSAEELLALAKGNGMELTEEEAKKFFDELHRESELSDDELNNVAGGGCGTPDPKYEAGQRVRYKYVDCEPYNGVPYSADKHGTIESARYEDYQEDWYYMVLMDNGVREEYPLESDLCILKVIS